MGFHVLQRAHSKSSRFIPIASILIIEDAELAAALLKVLTKSRVDFPHAEDFIEYLTIVCEVSSFFTL